MSELDLSQVREQPARDEAPAVANDPLALTHKLTICYNPDAQAVQALDFKNASDPKPEFKTWSYIIAVLDMAKRFAEQMEKMQQIQNMAQMQQEQAAAQQLAQRLRRNGHR
jgi:hypothetical protein